MSGSNYSFDDVAIPAPPVQIDSDLTDYIDNKLPTFLNAQYLSLLDLVSAIQTAFLITSDQITSVDADKITTNTQFTQNVFIGAESKIKLDGVNNQITIDDNQGTPVQRVVLGKLSATSNDYGIKIIDASGAVKFNSGSTTTMDGGIINANTITATQIAADTITATQIAAGTITATELAADSVTAAKIDVANLAAVSADLGTVTAGTLTGTTIQTAGSDPRVILNTSGIYAYKADGASTAFIGNDGQFRFGTASGNNIAWNNTALTVTGDIISTGNIEDGAITNPVVTTGTSSDGSNVDLTVSTKGGNIVGTISVVAVARGGNSVGTGIANMRVQIDGNTFKNLISSYATSGGGNVVVGQDTPGQTCTGTFLDGNPNGSIDSAADTTYTVQVDSTDQTADTTVGVVSYTVTLVTLELFK